jgi:hypothetical protein
VNAAEEQQQCPRTDTEQGCALMERRRHGAERERGVNGERPATGMTLARRSSGPALLTA